MGIINHNDVFIWNDYRRWRVTVLRLLRDFVDEAVLRELKRHPPRYFVSDNLSWLENAIRKVRGDFNFDISAILTERLCSHYKFVRAYHGCRSDSVESYQEDGVLPCDPSHLNSLALQIFQNQERVRAAIQELLINDGSFSYSDHNQGKVFFCLETEELTEYCGHYLLYGSEYLLAIATQIGERDVLRKRGRAMLVECNVPLADIPKEYVTCLAGEILEMIAEKYCVRPYHPQNIGFGFHINTKLQPQHIVGFHFPTRIPNPHNFGVLED